MMFCPWHIWFDFVQASLGIERVTFVGWPFPEGSSKHSTPHLGRLGPNYLQSNLLPHIVHSYV